MYKVVIDLAWGLRFDRWSSEKFFTRRPTTSEIKEAFKDEVTLADEDFEDYMSGRVVVDEIKVEL